MEVGTLSIREMLATDVRAAHAIRLRVRENQLSDPSKVVEQDYHDFMARDTRSWVCELNGSMIGFAMVDVEKRDVWALFVAPEHELKGAGRNLHDVLCAWYFQRADVLRLSTSPGTRAEGFYRAAGYTAVGTSANGEIIFELARPADTEEVTLTEG